MIIIKRQVEQELRLIVGLSTVTSQDYATVEDIRAAILGLPEEDQISLMSLHIPGAVIEPNALMALEEEVAALKAQLLIADKAKRIAESEANAYKEKLERYKKPSSGQNFQQRVTDEQARIFEARKAIRDAGGNPDAVFVGADVEIPGVPVPGRRGMTPLKATTKDNPPECKCDDWAQVGHPYWAYWPDMHPNYHHPDCEKYTAPPEDIQRKAKSDPRRHLAKCPTCRTQMAINTDVDGTLLKQWCWTCSDQSQMPVQGISDVSTVKDSGMADQARANMPLVHEECPDCDALIDIHRAGTTHCVCGEDWPCPRAKPSSPAPAQETRSERFRRTTGALTGGNAHPDRCKCQETGRYRDTPHVHYAEPPYACARCGCKAYDPALPETPETATPDHRVVNRAELTAAGASAAGEKPGALLDAVAWRLVPGGSGRWITLHHYRPDPFVCDAQLPDAYPHTVHALCDLATAQATVRELQAELGEWRHMAGSSEARASQFTSCAAYNALQRDRDQKSADVLRLTASLASVTAERDEARHDYEAEFGLHRRTMTAWSRACAERDEARAQLAAQPAPTKGE